MARTTAKIAPSAWDLVTLPEDRATAIGNMHIKLVKIATWLADRQTHTHTHARTHAHTQTCS